MKPVTRILICWIIFHVVLIFLTSFLEGPTKLYTETKHFPNKNSLTETEYVNWVVKHHVDEKYDLFVYKDNHYLFDVDEMPTFFDFFNSWHVMRLDIDYETECVTYTYYIGEPRVVYDQPVCDVDPSALSINAWLQ